MVVALYITEVPEFTIEHGIACVRARSHDEVLCWNLPLRDFRIAVARAERILAEHDSAGQVLALWAAH